MFNHDVSSVSLPVRGGEQASQELVHADLLSDGHAVDREQHAHRALHPNHIRAVLQCTPHQGAARLHCLQWDTQDQWCSGTPGHCSEQQASAGRRGEDRGVFRIDAGGLSMRRCFWIRLLPARLWANFVPLLILGVHREDVGRGIQQAQGVAGYEAAGEAESHERAVGHLLERDLGSAVQFRSGEYRGGLPENAYARSDNELLQGNVIPCILIWMCVSIVYQSLVFHLNLFKVQFSYDR